MIYMFLSNNPSSGDINSSNLSCLYLVFLAYRQTEGSSRTAMLHKLKEIIIKLTHYDETEKRAHDSQIVRAKENLQLSRSGPSLGQASGTTHRLKLYFRAVIESEA